MINATALWMQWHVTLRFQDIKDEMEGNSHSAHICTWPFSGFPEQPARLGMHYYITAEKMLDILQYIKNISHDCALHKRYVIYLKHRQYRIMLHL